MFSWTTIIRISGGHGTLRAEGYYTAAESGTYDFGLCVQGN